MFVLAANNSNCGRLLLDMMKRLKRGSTTARSLTLPFAAVMAGLMSACSTLQPADTAPEYTPPPAQTQLWDDVRAATADDWHVLLNDGPVALDWRLTAIDSAAESIEVQTFLWFFDTAGSMVLDHLLRAADRGVTVRMLIDDTFLVHEDELLMALAHHPNIEYRVFNPFKRRAGGVATRQLLNLAEFSRLDHRMHNKSMVVDNQVAIVGGRNLADEYFGLEDGANFRDLELLLGGDVVQEISSAFDKYWNDQWSFPIESIAHTKASTEQLAEARRSSDASSHLHAEVSAVQLRQRWLDVVQTADTGEAILYVDEPPEQNPKELSEAPVQVANELVDLFDAAQSEIVIITAYLIPTPTLEGAVKRALDRGVRVRILTNSLGSNNHLTAHSAYRKHVNTLLEYGAEMHEVRVDAEDRERYMLEPVDEKTLALHAKALLIDNDKVFVGSANLDPRSLRINTEMGFLILSEGFNQSTRRALDPDFSQDNSWRLRLDADDRVIWVSGDDTRTSQPDVSDMQKIEDWFFSHMPIEDEL